MAHWKIRLYPSSEYVQRLRTAYRSGCEAKLCDEGIVPAECVKILQLDGGQLDLYGATKIYTGRKRRSTIFPAVGAQRKAMIG